MKETFVNFIRALKSLFLMIIIIIRTLKSLLISSDPPSLPFLPFHLVEEILCRLPVKLLIQLRCQSKSFNTLISNPEFARKHLGMSSIAMDRHRLVLIDSNHRLSSSPRVISYPLHSIFYPRYSIFNSIVKATELEYPFDEEYIVNCGSCNGIICLAMEKYYPPETTDVLLWNPTIKKFKLLPSFQKILGDYYGLFGFGYDHVFDVYKVVAIFFSFNGFLKIQGMVHTLGTDSWRLINGEFPPPYYYQSLKFVNGALNWIPYEKNYTHSVVSFDLVTESYKSILQPNYGVEEVYEVILDVLRDCLCLFASRLKFSDVWMMKEYGNEGSWTKLFRVPNIKDNKFFSATTTHTLWLSEDEQVLVEYTILRKLLAVYDFKNGTFKFPKIQNINRVASAEIYVESLISPCL